MRKSIYTVEQIDALLSGKSMSFLGQYTTTDSVPTPVDGGHYLIGTSVPYDVYTYVSGTWVNAGPFQGPVGEKGEPGNNIASITRTSGNGAPGTTDTYTVMLTDGSTSTFQVYNGADGNGAGDMRANVYDPNRKAQDIFAYADAVREDVQRELAAKAPTYASVNMLASFWTGNTYSFEAAYPKDSYDISVEVAPSATAEQFEAFGSAMICGSADSNVATALGDAPTVDIPIIIKAVRK